MSERAETLAAQFEQANNDLIRTIEPMTDAQWKAVCSGENWSAGVVAHHVAGGHQPISGLVQAAATGQPLPPLTPEMLNQGNARHAQEYANCTKAETLDLLRQNGRTAAGVVRGLSDEQLQRSAPVFGNDMTAEQMIQNILIGHVQAHTASIKAAEG